MRLPATGACAAVLLLALTSCTQPSDPAPTGSSSPVAATATPAPTATAPTVAPAPTASGAATSEAPEGPSDPGPAEPGTLSTADRSGAATGPGELASLTVTPASGGASDLLTFTFSGSTVPAYRVGYVEQVQRRDEPLLLDGSAALEITFTDTAPGPAGATADGVATQESYDLPAVRQVVLVENLGGTVRFGVGVTDRTEFRVLADGQTLTVELSHP